MNIAKMIVSQVLGWLGGVPTTPGSPWQATAPFCTSAHSLPGCVISYGIAANLTTLLSLGPLIPPL
jgi:hypothetical protein